MPTGKQPCEDCGGHNAVVYYFGDGTCLWICYPCLLRRARRAGPPPAGEEC